MQQLFDAQTGNGSSAEVQLDGSNQAVAIRGTWDGATVTVEWSPDGASGNYASVGSDGEFSADGNVMLAMRFGKVRLTLSSAGGSTDLDGWVG